MTTSIEITYQVQPNDTNKTHFKWKVVRTSKYDSGHTSTIDLDFFVEKYDANKFVEKLYREDDA